MIDPAIWYGHSLWVSVSLPRITCKEFIRMTVIEWKIHIADWFAVVALWERYWRITIFTITLCQIRLLSPELAGWLMGNWIHGLIDWWWMDGRTNNIHKVQWQYNNGTCLHWVSHGHDYFFASTCSCISWCCWWLSHVHQPVVSLA